MKITSKKFETVIKKFQEGGEMPSQEAPVEGGAPAEAPVESGEDPMQQLMMACQQVLETQDCNLAMQVIQAVMQMIGGAPQEAPAAPEGQQPVYGKGGRLVKWISK